MAARGSPLDEVPGLFDAPVMLSRFLLVIEPIEQASDAVREMKKKLRERIGGFSGSGSVPHITLFFTDLPGECERDVCEGVAHGCMGMQPFELHLNGIHHFPDRKTIYIDPVEKESIGMVRKSVVAHVRSFKNIRKLGVSATDHPHLTIAAGLKMPQFEQAWQLLAPHAFTSEQQVNEVVLLRRDLRPESRYEVVRHFPLELIAHRNKVTWPANR